MPAYKDEERGTWYAMFYYTDWQGTKRKTKKRGFVRKKDALDYEREFLNKEQSSCDMSFASLTDLYFADMQTRLRETTIEGKKHIFTAKILPYFQNLPINQIKATYIRKWQSELMTQNYAPTYLKTINNQLSAIFNYAVRYYKLPENPVRIAGSMGKKKAGEMDIWTLEEFKRFIAVVDKPAVKLAFEIMFWSGARVGETLALFPKDILPERVIDINKTTSRRDGIDNFYDPKTNKSLRKIPIPEFLYEEIQGYIGKLYGIKPDDQIFYFAKSTLNKSLDYYAEKAGVKRIRVHDIRHAYVKLLLKYFATFLRFSP